MSAKKKVAWAAGVAQELSPQDGKGRVSAHLERIFSELDSLRSMVRLATEIQDDRAQLWNGVEAIEEAIQQTRGEISALHSKAVHDRDFNRASDELDAVVSDTESATETILGAAETIDEIAGKLGKDNDAIESEVAEIRAQAIKIFEACNFQDITGQRISKVVNVLHFIEGRITSMLEIWGGSDTEGEFIDERTGDDALLNGPALADEVNVVSQDDIDSLFP
ncbi:protein phosphatase CheZ [Afifella sp. IM 167]|uniref:protein phosphatase CheZ n=1 Tax=Afifella sp. IM 167 TaxID=2033586 RepID=UPI001CCC8377|nr:protein phosphatase CheZ [Afifella sp. IM 167]MBZ8131768.1 hypothetical protein [Afifella sp. IM 167]